MSFVSYLSLVHDCVSVTFFLSVLFTAITYSNIFTFFEKGKMLFTDEDFVCVKILELFKSFQHST